MKNWYSFVDVIAPASCMACGEHHVSSESLLCIRCLAQLPKSVRPLRSLQPVRASWALGPYTGMLGGLVRKAKYGHCIPVADQLGHWLGERIKGLVHVDAVTHVPNPWYRRLYRGFDPPFHIAQGVAAQIGVSSVHLLRRKGGARQVGKSARDRLSLHLNVFEGLNHRAPARVLLIDDVMTTGATLRTAARCLRRHGAKEVYAALVAYA